MVRRPTPSSEDSPTQLTPPTPPDATPGAKPHWSLAPTPASGLVKQLLTTWEFGNGKWTVTPPNLIHAEYDKLSDSLVEWVDEYYTVASAPSRVHMVRVFESGNQAVWWMSSLDSCDHALVYKVEAGGCTFERFEGSPAALREEHDCTDGVSIDEEAKCLNGTTSVKYFEGDSKREHLVRIENNEGTFYYDGPRTEERLYRIDRPSGNQLYFSGPRGEEHKTWKVELNGDCTFYIGSKGKERKLHQTVAETGEIKHYGGKRGAEVLWMVVKPNATIPFVTKNKKDEVQRSCAEFQDRYAHASRSGPEDTWDRKSREADDTERRKARDWFGETARASPSDSDLLETWEECMRRGAPKATTPEDTWKRQSQEADEVSRAANNSIPRTKEDYCGPITVERMRALARAVSLHEAPTDVQKACDEWLAGC